MSTNPKGKLALRPETLRTLSSRELTEAAGGFTNISDSCACRSFVCSIASDCPTAACPKERS